MHDSNFKKYHHRRCSLCHHRLIGINLTDQSCRSHSGTRSIIRHMYQHGRNRSQYGTCENSRKPDQGLFHDISNLKHTGSKPLRQQPVHLIFTVRSNRETDHIRTASNGCSTCCYAVKSQNDSKRCRADRKRKDHSHQNRYHNSH